MRLRLARRTKGGSLSQISHELTGRHRTMRLRRTLGRMLTCRYGFRGTGWTLSIELRIKRARASTGQRDRPDGFVGFDVVGIGSPGLAVARFP